MNRSRDRLAHQFSLEPQQIARVVHAAARGESADLANALWSRAAQQSRPRLEGLATRIEPAAEWSDLVVPPQIDDALREICDQLRHRHRVHEQWGIARRGGRGTAITALFHGPSGTGKTLAAEVIHARPDSTSTTDLSQIVDKYVGETEKRLRQVFDAADQAGAILLFDEAMRCSPAPARVTRASPPSAPSRAPWSTRISRGYGARPPAPDHAAVGQPRRPPRLAGLTPPRMRLPGGGHRPEPA